MSSAALITGAGHRIGRAIAIGLAREGYDIALHYNSSLEKAKEVQNIISNLGRDCELFSCNFNNIEKISGFIDSVLKRLPGCNVLINNASIFKSASFLETNTELFNAHFNINFKAPFFLSQDFARRIETGQIINILDSKITRSLIPYFAYSLSKKMLHEFTLMAAKALGPGIRVNGVAPGHILPPQGQDREYPERLSKKTPLQYPGDPDDIVEAVLFLIKHSYITGQCLYVDAGEHIT